MCEVSSQGMLSLSFLPEMNVVENVLLKKNTADPGPCFYIAPQVLEYLCLSINTKCIMVAFVNMQF